MKRSIVLSLALMLAPAPALAQSEPPGPPPDAAAAGWSAPSPAQRAAMEQFRTAAQQYRVQTRSNMLASLTPAHRTALASLVGQLALTPNPNYKAAIAQVDAMLSPNERTSIVTISTAERNSMRALMQQQRAALASTLTPAQQTEMAQREAKRQAFEASHPRPAHVPDPGAILLRTLASPAGGWGGGHHGGGPA
jgi:hypothetical protein